MEHEERLKAALADRYRIEREIGSGGMATVYLALDLKHDRSVALKVLKPELAAVLGADRFVQEIKTTANLQHPHILPLFDSGEADSFLYYVMPYIEGETLRDKLNRETQLGIDEAIRITAEVADALDYAHRHTVIHRDIKPENILLHDGRPMVADFGIALAVSAAAGGRMTETGLSLGTPHYMSPEQATAEKDLTNKSDIYSLGAMLYEMLTGSPPHVGSSAQQIIMKIVTDEARPVTELRKAVPPNVSAATAKSLEKLPADRFESTAKFAEALTNPRFTLPKTQVAVAGASVSDLWNRLSIGLVLGMVLLLLVAMWGWFRQPISEGGGVRRFTVRLPDSAPLAIGTGRPAVALAPDGTRLVFVARVAGEHRILIKDLITDSVLTVAGSEGGTGPFLSHDGRLGFFERRRLLATSVDGEPASPLEEFTPVTRGASWLDDSTVAIVRSPDDNVTAAPLGRPDLDRDMSDPRNWVTPDGQPRAWPEVLPGSRAVVYAVAEGADPDGWRLAVAGPTLDGERILVNGGSNPHYVASGHLVFVRQGGLWAVRFDLNRLETQGEPVLVEPGVITESDGFAHFSVSRDGTLIYAAGSDWEAARRLVWVGTDGSVEPLPLESGAYFEVALAPEGRRMAVTRAVGSNYDVWIGDVSRAGLAPVTRDPREDGSPVWSPNGRRLAIATEQFGSPPKLAIADLLRDEITLIGDSGTAFSAPTAWSRDGRALFFVSAPVGIGVQGRLELRMFDVERETQHTWLGTGNNERAGVPRSGGRWVTYVSDESGRDEVYLRDLAGEGPRILVSTEGGRDPRWGQASGAVYFRNGDRIFTVTVSTGPGGEPNLSTPRMAFQLPPDFFLTGGFNGAAWDLSPDEQRVLAIVETQDLLVTSLNVVVNFFEELKEKVGR